MAESPLEVIVHAQGAPDSITYIQAFDNGHAALACIRREVEAGRSCTLRIRRTAVAEPIKHIARAHIGNR
jgi:hypothetical protein